MNQTGVAVLRVGLVVVALCIASYILAPPLYWHFREGLAAVKHSSSSCAPCLCDCSSQQPILSIPQGAWFSNFSCLFIFCVLILLNYPFLDLVKILIFSSLGGPIQCLNQKKEITV